MHLKEMEVAMIDTIDTQKLINHELVQMVMEVSIFDSIVFLILLEFYVRTEEQEGLKSVLAHLEENLELYTMPTKAIDYPGLPAATIQLRQLLRSTSINAQSVQDVTTTFSQLLSRP